MRGRRRTRIVARVDDGTAAVSVTWFNQPWLADKLKPGNADQAARQARPLRLRAALVRHRREARATADFAPVYPAAEEIAAATVRRVVDAALPLAVERPRSAARRAARTRGARAEARRARRGAPAARPRRGGDAARQRLAFEELLVLQIGIARRVGRARADPRAGARRAGRADPPLPRGAAVRAHAVPGAGDPRDRRRPRAHRPDAAAPAGRRRLGQDGRRALRAPPRGRERPPGRAHGADGNPR